MAAAVQEVMPKLVIKHQTDHAVKPIQDKHSLFCSAYSS